MECTIIKNKENILYPVFKELYEMSFPVFEQRTGEQQDKAFLCPEYHLSAYTENGIFIGFICYWEFKTYIYIEHFAINQTLRGKGHGSLVLSGFIKENSKIVLLEIDPITDDISAARLRFYQKCGFHLNRFAHIHPPYRDNRKGHTLLVLTTEREITENEYGRFYDDLSNQIMK